MYNHNPFYLLLLIWLSCYYTVNAQQNAGSILDQIPGRTVTTYRSGKVVTYRLTVADTVVNFTGKPTSALATNGSIPAPTLHFTEGDSARIFVTNRTDGTVSFHWHGLLLPNEYDGVPLLNTELIRPGDTYMATFPIVQNGTYWYHSHTGFQEQKGLYGAIVIQPRQPDPVPSQEVVLSDFTTQNPHEVLRQVKKHTDWYAIKRNAVQSYGKALFSGNFGKQLWLEWKRMPGMDLADIYYDAFLANGRPAFDYPDLKAGDTLRLRIINGSASSHFWLHYAGGQMRVVAADGIEVDPVAVDKLLIATAETYDVEVTLPADGRYEFRATSWDRYRHTSIWLGTGTEHPAQPLGKIDYFKLTGEMRDLMKSMPDMVMGKAPAKIPEPKVYSPGEAPSGQELEMKAMQEMGMEMDMDMSMGHGAAPMTMDSMTHEGHPDRMPANAHKMPMDHSAKEQPADTMNQDQKMSMDRPAMDHNDEHVMPEGHIIRASEVDGKTMEMPGMQAGKDHQHMGSPRGLQLTGYQELQERFPDDVILNYGMLRSREATALQNDRPVRVVHLYLGGNMLRYVWMINNIPLSKADKIMIERGETVRFVFHNTTMMSHPMHLHGHFFRVLNGAGDHAPLKHTVNVASMETTVIEFAATEDKDWFFHCHLLYHMMSGMARIIGYENSSDLMIADRKDYDQFAMEDRKWWGKANLSAQTNGVWADLGYFNTYNELSLEANGDYEGNFEGVFRGMRYLDPKQFLAPYLGFRMEGERLMDNEIGRMETELSPQALIGLRYLLPMMIWSDLSLNQKGQLRFELEREDIPIASRWRASAGVEYLLDENSWEYTIGTSYIMGQYWGLSAKYDNRYGWGGGLMLMW